MKISGRDVACVIVALVVFACNTEVPKPVPTPVARVAVPYLIGEALTRANADLDEAGLRSDEGLGGPCPPAPPGHIPFVTDQLPRPGVLVTKNSVVHLNVC